MPVNPYAPPKAELLTVQSRLKPDIVWFAMLLAGVCVVSGMVRMVFAALAATQGGLNLGTFYIIAIGPTLWCILGFLLFKRSKYALAAALAAVAIPYLTNPWVEYVIQRSIGLDTTYFNYWNAVSLAVKSVTFDAILYAAVIGYTAWDYRERFAGWRQ